MGEGRAADGIVAAADRFTRLLLLLLRRLLEVFKKLLYLAVSGQLPKDKQALSPGAGRGARAAARSAQPPEPPAPEGRRDQAPAASARLRFQPGHAQSCRNSRAGPFRSPTYRRDFSFERREKYPKRYFLRAIGDVFHYQNHTEGQRLGRPPPHLGTRERQVFVLEFRRTAVPTAVRLLCGP